MWLTFDSGPADAGSRAGASDPFVSGSIHPKPDNRGTVAAAADMRGSNSRLQLASLQTGGDSATALRESDDQSKPSARSSFGERFAFDLASAPSSFLRTSQAAGSFDDRFIGEVFAASTAVRSAAAAPPAAPRSVVAQASVAQAAPKRSTEARFRLASASATSLPLPYAPTNSVKGSAMGSSLKALTLKDFGPTRRRQSHRDLRHHGSDGVSAERTEAGSTFRPRRPHGRSTLRERKDDRTDAAERL